MVNHDIWVLTPFTRHDALIIATTLLGLLSQVTNYYYTFKKQW